VKHFADTSGIKGGAGRGDALLLVTMTRTHGSDSKRRIQMSRVKLLVWIVAPVALLSGCSLRQPVYNPVLGGFPMYKHTKQVSHDAQSHDKARHKPGKAQQV
jgi:hypothetical protein